MKAKFKKASELKSEQGLKYLLHKELAVTDPPRSIKTLHASELTREDIEFCPRERAFLLRDGDNRKDGRLGTSLNVTFQVGRFYEEMVRDKWLRKYALGNWKCLACDHLHEYQTVPETCDNCSMDGDVCLYLEPRAYSPEYDCSCGIDMLLWKDEILTPVEIKTIDKDQFRELHAPLSEHRKRTQFYLDLLSHSTWMDFDVKLNLDFGYLLYCCKGFGFADNMEGRQGISDAKFSPFKEYKVKRGDGKALQSVYAKALAVKKFHTDGVVPKREICPTITCKRAKRCTYRETCFSEKS
jgi:hypothetical protein